MAVYELYSDADWIWNQRQTNPVVDQDIISFCGRSPHLIELAFSLADHGHTHVGHVVRLSQFTLSDFANGDKNLAGQLRLNLQRAGLDTGMQLKGWVEPVTDDD